MITQWLQGPQDLGPLAAALCFVPNAVISVVGSLLNHRLAQRGGHVATIGIGAIIMAGGLLLTGGGVRADSLAVTIVGFALVGLGQGFVIPSGVELIMTSAAPEQAGSAAGVNETIVEAGGALGVAVMGSVLVASASFAWPMLVAAAALAAGAATSVRIQRRRATLERYELRSTRPR